MASEGEPDPPGAKYGTRHATQGREMLTLTIINIFISGQLGQQERAGCVFLWLFRNCLLLWSAAYLQNHLMFEFSSAYEYRVLEAPWHLADGT